MGVAFYLMAALGRRLGAAKKAARYLDLVAIGTMADLVKLDRNNRILIRQGLSRIASGHCRPGILGLCRTAGVPPGEITGSSLAYQIAPRLNAAGRLDDMNIGVRCLVTDSDEEALELANRLNELNRERRAIGARMNSEALERLDAETLIDPNALPPVVCLFRDDWHEGLVGLVASKIKERYHRPVFAFAPNDSGAMKGSGRSVAGFHLRDALVDVDAGNPGLIARFGGHAMAAGLTLRRDGFAKFRAAMETLGGQRLRPEHLAERILTDGELEAGDLTLEVAALLRGAGPWGAGVSGTVVRGVFPAAWTTGSRGRPLENDRQTGRGREPRGRHRVPSASGGLGNGRPAASDLPAGRQRIQRRSRGATHRRRRSAARPATAVASSARVYRESPPGDVGRDCAIIRRHSSPDTRTWNSARST